LKLYGCPDKTAEILRCMILVAKQIKSYVNHNRGLTAGGDLITVYMLYLPPWISPRERRLSRDGMLIERLSSVGAIYY